MIESLLKVFISYFQKYIRPRHTQIIKSKRYPNYTRKNYEVKVNQYFRIYLNCIGNMMFIYKSCIYRVHKIQNF